MTAADVEITPEEDLFYDGPTDGPSIPDVTDLDGCGAALAYASNGIYVVPVRAGTKHPGSVVGSAWQHRSTTDTKEIIALWAGTSHGVALHLGRSGLVAFDVDHPEAVPAELQRAIDECAPPFQRSRPTEVGRGHYVFAVPPGRSFGNGTGQLGDAWGQVRGRNGVIIVAPSVHEHAADGAAYEWLTTGPVPVLPDYVADLLPDTTDHNDAATTAEVEAFLAKHTGNERPELLAGRCTTFDRKVQAGASRHDTMVVILTGAMEEAAAGYFPAAQAADRLRDLLVGALATDRPGRARSEYEAILAWSVSQAKAKNPADVRARVDAKMPKSDITDLVVTSTPSGPPPGIDPETGEVLATATTECATAADPDLFEATDMLRHIRDFARSRRASPLAVLGCVLVRAVCAVEPWVVLPPIVGGQTSLNLFLAVVGQSGAGKGVAEEAGRDAVTFGPKLEPPLHETGTGSAEGLAKVYFRYVKAKGDDPETWEQYRTRALFRAAEIDTLAALAGRNGGTSLLPEMRKAWGGDNLTFAYAGNDKRPPIREHTYRMGFIVGAQPGRSRWIMEDADGGTPQRFLWMPALDAAMPSARPPAVEPRHAWDRLDWPPATPATSRRSEMPVDPAVIAEVDQLRVAINRGERDPLDGHAGQMRLKVAAALAILHAETAVTGQWWTLASDVLAVSDRERDAVLDELRRKASASNLARADAEADRVIHVDERKAQATVRRLANNIENALTSSGNEWTTGAVLRKKVTNSRNRGFFDDAINHLVLAERIEVEDVTYRGQSGTRYRPRSSQA